MNEKNANLPSKDEVLQNEDDLLSNLLAAAKFKTDEGSRKLIRIARNSKVLFGFHIRPLDETELQECRKNATKYAPSPANRAVRVEVDVDYSKLRALKIYTATIPEDRKKVWDNKALQDKLGVITGADVVDALLMAGEKDTICDLIDDLSGYNVSLEETAKN